MSKKLGLLLLMVLMFTGIFAMVSPASAGNVTESCTTKTLTYTVVKDWVFEYLKIDVLTVRAVAELRYNVIPLSDRHVLDFDITYIKVSGEVVLAHGTITLSDSCTPDWQKAHTNWTCETSSVTQSFDEIIRRGHFGGAVLDYDSWLVGFFHKGTGIGVQYEEWELKAFYFQYLISVGVDITTSTTRCTTYIGPTGQEMLLWTFNGGNTAFVGHPVKYFWMSPDGALEPVKGRLDVVDTYGDISIILPPGDYPSDPAYGEWNVIDGFGHQDVIVPSMMFVAQVDGTTVETVIVGPSTADKTPLSYVVLAHTDTVNLALRTSTPNRIAWKS